MGLCLSQCSGISRRRNGVHDATDRHSPTADQVPSPSPAVPLGATTSAVADVPAKKNVVAPAPPVATSVSATNAGKVDIPTALRSPERVKLSLQGAASWSPRLMRRDPSHRDGSGRGGGGAIFSAPKSSPRRLERSNTLGSSSRALAHLADIADEPTSTPAPVLPSGSASSTSSSPTARARHKSMVPRFRHSGSESRLILDNSGLHARRHGSKKKLNKKKPVAIGLDVLLRDERARLGFFKYLRAAAVQEKLHDNVEHGNECTLESSPIQEEHEDGGRDLSSGRSQRKRPSASDHPEDCALFWLEISDLLKIPTTSASGSISSFQIGLMDDLFDVYVAKNAPRLLPMVSASEREMLSQYLADRNAERALFVYKMLLLDVLDVVTAHFDEYVRTPGSLGYAHATQNASMRNVLSLLAKRAAGGDVAGGDRRSHIYRLVSTPALCRMFREFLEARNSVENLLFIIDALDFEDLVNTFQHRGATPLVQLPEKHEVRLIPVAEVPASASDVLNPDSEDVEAESHQDYCVREANKIFTKYVRYGSKAEVCLSTSVKDRLLERLVEYPLSANIFGDAVLLCCAELVQNHLDAFYRTVAYTAYQAAAHQRKHTTNDASGSKDDASPPLMNGPSATGIPTTVVLPPAGPNPVGTGGGSSSTGGGKSGGPTLAEILEGHGVHAFRDFLRQQGKENSILFYKDVCEFQLLPHSQRQYIQTRARRIFDKYVRRGARLELELPVETRRDILWKLSAPSEATFADATRYVLRHWEARDLPKFRSSPLYQEMLDQIAAAPPTRQKRGDGAKAETTGGSAGGDCVDVSSLTLREFLELEQLRKFFRQFLEREQCANEMYFYFEIATFQQFPTSDYLTRQAKKLYNRFCEPQSREFVAFADDTLRKELQHHLANPSPAMFNKAQEQILAFFATTLFPKFQQSEIYSGIRISSQQLRAARMAAMGAASRRHLDVNRGARGSVGFGLGSHTGGNVGEAADGGNDCGLPESEVTVSMILENPETRSLFLFFSEEIFCTESIYFWLDCNEYKDIPHRNYLKLRAQKIFRKYICGRAKLQVNLESALIREIETHLDEPTRTLFLAAQRSITKMLERDTLPKFRRSKHFQPCLQLLRAAL